MTDLPINKPDPKPSKILASQANRVFKGSENEVDAFNAREFNDLQARDFVPREIYIQVSKRCNLQCVMCSWPTWTTNVGLMDLGLFHQILDDAQKAGVSKVIFGNAQGEPFLHPQIIEMLEASLARGFWTMVSTNGTALTPARIEGITKSGLHNIQFSFAGYNKQVYELVYAGGKWENVTRNMQLLAQSLNKTHNRTNMVINGCYANELLPLVSPNAFIARTRSFLRSIGIQEPHQQVQIHLPHNFGGNIDTGSEQIRHLKSHFAITTRQPALCRVLKNGMGIYFDGKITACGCLDPNGDLAIGQITPGNLAEVRKQEPYQKLLGTFMAGNIDELPLCSGCDLPYYDSLENAPATWQNKVKERAVFSQVLQHVEPLELGFCKVTSLEADPLLQPFLGPDLEIFQLRQDGEAQLTKKIQLDEAPERTRYFLAEIEAAERPLVIFQAHSIDQIDLGFAALDTAGYDVFLFFIDKTPQSSGMPGYEPSFPVYRNAIIDQNEQYFILSSLDKSRALVLRYMVESSPVTEIVQMTDLKVGLPIWIQGAGSYGQFIQQHLLTHPDYQVAGYFDSFKSGICNGLPVLHPHDFDGLASEVAVILASKDRFNILTLLRGLGFCNIYSFKTLEQEFEAR